MFLIVVTLLAVLALSVWFAAASWARLGGESIPPYGYVAIVGGVLFSLLIGGGLMALVFLQQPARLRRRRPSLRQIDINFARDAFYLRLSSHGPADPICM
jgi:TRAP-type C4-dicarboxylate transport system permease small subunit